MSVEELMKPRWKVIADFPYNQAFDVGEIVTGIKHWNYDHQYYIAPHPYDIFDPNDYPAIFKELDWWEERKEEDMPKFLKYGINIYPVFCYHDKTVSLIGKFPYGANMIDLRATLPSSKEEYEDYKESVLFRDKETIKSK